MMKFLISLIFSLGIAFRLFVMYIIWQAQLEVDTQIIRSALIAGVMIYLVTTIRRIVIFTGVLD